MFAVTYIKCRNKLHTGSIFRGGLPSESACTYNYTHSDWKQATNVNYEKIIKSYCEIFSISIHYY